MHTQILTETRPYYGPELRSHWIYDTTGVPGDGVVAFSGPCEVKLADLVDLADVQANAPIYSEHMLHFLIEHFHSDLRSMVLRQRLLTAQVGDLLRLEGVNVQRQGDDLFDGEAKLSVSIATVSPVSGLIHFGINVSSENTPVLTRGLQDYGLQWQEFAEKVLKKYTSEEKSIQNALVKVRWVS